jgi:hypothetical protein
MSDLLNQASLVMVPSGYKEDTVYSVVPSDGSGDLSFTRASNGTRINSAGLVEVCPWNLQTYSEDFTNGKYILSQASISSNTTTAPNGTATADKLVENTANDQHFVYFTAEQTAYNETRISVYAKAGGRTNLLMWESAITNAQSLFNLSTGVVTSSSSGNAANLSTTVGQIEDAGNGWYRCSFNYSTSSGGGTIRLQLYTTTTSYTGDGTSGIFIWGLQENIGSTAKPYFPTTDRLNVPRLTYQNGGGGCPSLLLEKQSTNLALWSEDFTQTAWVKSASNSITANAIISPDGTQNADFIVSTASNTAAKYAYQVIASTATPTATIYAKAGAVTEMMFYCQHGNGIYFNLTNGAFVAYYGGGSSTITSYSSVAVGNGWYRYSLTFNTSVTSIEIYMSVSGNISPYIANGDGFYIWGAQLEASNYPTSYINTTSASATRVADYPSRSGLALTNFTFAVNFKPLAYVVELFDFEKTGGGRMFYVAVQSNGFITFNSVSGGTIGAIGSVLTINQTCKLAFKLNASTSNLTVFINGSNIGTYTTNITTFGAFFGLQSFGYNPGTQIEQIAIFPSVLTDAECISLTTL